MNINFWLNGVNRHAEISPDTLLIDFLRKQGCFSVKRGCETANCGLCTVLMDLSLIHIFCGVNRCTEQILDNDRNRQFKHLPVKIILTGR